MGEQGKGCAEPGCMRPHRARGFCGSHYMKRYGKPQQPKRYTCEVCGAEIQRSPGKRYTKVCPGPCWYFHTYKRWPTCDIPGTHPVLSCPIPRGHPAWTPPKPPRATRGSVPKLAPFTPEQRDCAWCGNTYTAQRSSIQYCTIECKRRAKVARRRGNEHEAVGSYTWAEVIGLFLAFDRRCAYCDVNVCTQPDPDHVVPLSRGGANSITNILPSCRSCNSDKRDLLLNEWAEDRKRRGLPPVRTSWKRGDLRYRHITSVIPKLSNAA